MFGKAMAHVERIKNIYPVEGADAIEMAQVLDWHVVVKKGEFSIGQLAMYIEVDSIVPDGLPVELKKSADELVKSMMSLGKAYRGEVETKLAEITIHNTRPEYEFLRSRKFKIRVVEYKKFNVISQGILFSLNTVITPSIGKYILANEGEDYTERLGITQIIEDEEESGTNNPTNNKSLLFLEQNRIGKFINKKLMKYPWYRTYKAGLKDDSTWPKIFPSKSDETNAQAVFTKMKNLHGGERWYVTEKLEGQNISIVSRVKKFLWFTTNDVGVCSRTRFMPSYDGSLFWRTVRKHGYDKKVKELKKHIFIRGEHIGPSIQSNIYSFNGNDIYIFDVYELEDKRMLSYLELVVFCSSNGFKMVPVIDDDFRLPETVQELLEYSNGYSTHGEKVLREGIVLRLVNNPKVSFKVRSPKYLAKQD